MDPQKALRPSPDLSPQALLSLGVDELVYIKAVVVDGHTAYGLFGADGSHLAMFQSREHAAIAARRNDYEPVSVH